MARQEPALAPAALAILDQVPVTEQGRPDPTAIGDLLEIRPRAAAAV